MFLRQDEVRQLSGKKYPKHQVAALTAMGIPCKINSANQVLVLRSFIKAQFSRKGLKGLEPNFAAVNAIAKKKST